MVRLSVKTEVEVMEEFQLESCARDHHIYKSTWTPLLGKYFLRLHGLMFDATLGFSVCFLKILLG